MANDVDEDFAGHNLKLAGHAQARLLDDGLHMRQPLLPPQLVQRLLRRPANDADQVLPRLALHHRQDRHHRIRPLRPGGLRKAGHMAQGVNILRPPGAHGQHP